MNRTVIVLVSTMSIHHASIMAVQARYPRHLDDIVIVDIDEVVDINNEGLIPSREKAWLRSDSHPLISKPQLTAEPGFRPPAVPVWFKPRMTSKKVLIGKTNINCYGGSRAKYARG